MRIIFCASILRTRCCLVRYIKVLTVYTGKVWNVPALAEVGGTYVLRHAIVGEIVALSKLLANSLKILETVTVTWRNKMSFVPFVPIVNHHKLFAVGIFGKDVGHLFKIMQKLAKALR